MPSGGRPKRALTSSIDVDSWRCLPEQNQYVFKWTKSAETVTELHTQCLSAPSQQSCIFFIFVFCCFLFICLFCLFFVLFFFVFFCDCFFFPTCQVRVVRFCASLFSSSSFASPAASLSEWLIDLCGRLNHDLVCSVWRAEPQPRARVFSVACRTSTASS